MSLLPCHTKNAFKYLKTSKIVGVINAHSAVPDCPAGFGRCRVTLAVSVTTVSPHGGQLLRVGVLPLDLPLPTDTNWPAGGNKITNYGSYPENMELSK